MSHGATAAHVHQAPTGFIRKYIFSMDHKVIGMVNLLFTISTAEGGFVVLLEDMVVHRDHRHHGYGDRLLQYAIDYARQSVGWVECSETHRWAANAGRWVTALRA